MGQAGYATRFALGSLAAWRVTHLLAEEDGPADVVLRLRMRMGTSRLGELMDCFACLSIWVSTPISFVVAGRGRDVPMTCLAISGAACLLERITEAADRPQPSLVPASPFPGPRPASVPE